MSEKDQSNGLTSDSNAGSKGQEEFWFSEEAQSSSAESRAGKLSRSGQADSRFLLENSGNQPASGAPFSDKNGASSSEIYGLREPVSSDFGPKLSEPPLYSSGENLSDSSSGSSRSSAESVRSGLNRAKRAQKEQNFEDDFEKDEKNFSLDDLYDRKNRQKSAMTEDEFEEGQFERTELPRHPFWDRFFHPFIKIGFLFRFALLVLAAIIPIFLVLFILICLKIPRTDIAGEVVRQSGEVILAFDSSKLFFLSFFWGIISFPYAVFILEGSAAADDDLSEWPEFSMLGAIGMLCRLGLLILTAAIPAGILSSFLSFSPVWIFALFGGILIPIFLLSTLNADNMFIFLTKDVLKSFRKNAGAWLKFYAVSVILAALSLTLSYAAAQMIGNSGNRLGVSFIFSLILAFGFSFIIYIYWRMLGRLAWVIDDTVRKNIEELDDSTENSEEKQNEISDNDSDGKRGEKV